MSFGNEIEDFTFTGGLIDKHSEARGIEKVLSLLQLVYSEVWAGAGYGFVFFTYDIEKSQYDIRDKSEIMTFLVSMGYRIDESSYRTREIKFKWKK